MRPRRTRVLSRTVALCAASGVVAATVPSAGAQTFEAATIQRFFSLTLSDEVFGAQLRYPEATSSSPATRSSYQLALIASVRGRPVDAVGLRFGLDSGLLDISSDGLLIDGGPAADRARETLFLGETWIDAQVGPSGVFQGRLGKLRPRLGDGLIFDQYAWGAFVDVDLTLVDAAPVGFRFLFAFPSGRLVRQTFERPLMEARVRFELGPRTRLSAFSIWHLENDGLAPVLAQALVRGRFESFVADLDRRIEEAPPLRRDALIAVRDQTIASGAQAINAGDFTYDAESRGWLGWSGLSFAADFGAATVEAVGSIGYGDISTEFRPSSVYRQSVTDLLTGVRDNLNAAGRDRLASGIDAFIAEGGIEDLLVRQERRADLNLLSALGRILFRYRVQDLGEVDAFVVAQSGDGALPSDLSGEASYGAFVTLAPLFDASSLFFNGAVAPALASPGVASLAPDNAGLIAAGAGMRAWFLDCCSARLRGAIMNATVESSASGSAFYGAEVNLAAEVFLSESLLASADGAVFFPGGYFANASAAWQAVVGLQVVLE